MKILLLSLTLQTMSSPDRWFSVDKVQHFFLGSFAQSATYGLLRAAKIEEKTALVGASAMSIAAAVGKEIRDRKGGDPSIKDATWTLAGAAAISPLLARTR